MTQPLTNEQIWGVPEEQMPDPEIKDFFATDFTDDTESTEEILDTD